ncbi:MAG: serine hydrolase domain-containing protein [bacterium]
MKKTIASILFMLTFLFVSCDGNKKTSGEEKGSDEESDNFLVDKETVDDEFVDPRLEIFISALKKDLEKSNALGVSAAIMKNGEIVFSQALGFKDVEKKTPLTTDTLMQIGSTTKQMTAAALLQKVEKGKVSLENSLSDILPELKFKYDETWTDFIKIHHLLSHQGGFFDWTPWDLLSDDDIFEGVARSYVNKYFVMNPPGVFYNYSNPHFSFLGLITESLDDRFWSDIIKEDVFSPLGMDRTYARLKEVKKDSDYSDSFGYNYKDVQSLELVDLTIDEISESVFTRPAGLVWTTPEQMMKWADFIMNGNTQVLSDELRSKMTTPHIDTLYGSGTMFYGYGVIVETGYQSKDGNWYQTPVWQHGGNTISFTNIFYIFPELDFALSICSSGYGTDFSESVDVAVSAFADLPKPSKDVPKHEIDPDKFDSHTGTYNDAFNVGTMIITKEGNSLLVSAPTLEEYGYKVEKELIPISSDIFILSLDGDLLDITFVKENGESKYMRNRIFVLTKVEEEETLKKPSKQQVTDFIIQSKLNVNHDLHRLIKTR